MLFTDPARGRLRKRVNQLTATTDRNGRATTFAYNSGGQQTGETWLNSSGGTTNLISYTYNADNELTNVSDNYATLSMTYDSGGNQLTVATSGPGTGQPSVTLTSGYDKFHDRTSLVDNLSSVGRTTFQYDAAFRLTTISASFGSVAGPQVVLGYDPGNRLTSISRTIGGLGTSVNTSYVYDAANRIGTITDQVGSTPLATYLYGYDKADRVTTEVNAEGTVTFGYDSGGELLTARGSRTENYSYDSGGNRNMSGWTTGTGNELTASPGYTYTYDNEGNLLAQTNTSTHVTTSFSYDNRNRLTQVTVGGTVVASYTYDALSHRIGIKDNGTQTWVVFDGTSPDANPYADFNGSGTLLTRYVSTQAVDEILARTSSGGTTAWYLTDRLGSVRDVVNTSGTVIDHVIYDSYGNITSETSPANGDRFKFTGMEWDAAIGQYYDHARWYSGGVGRFESQDPSWFQPGDSNLYRYAGNACTEFVDNSGLSVGPPKPPPGWLPPPPPGFGPPGKGHRYLTDDERNFLYAAWMAVYEREQVGGQRILDLLNRVELRAYADSMSTLGLSTSESAAAEMANWNRNRAITFREYQIYYQGLPSENSAYNIFMLAHEFQHTVQWSSMGTDMFTGFYIAELYDKFLATWNVNQAYMRNEMEAQARAFGYAVGNNTKLYTAFINGQMTQLNEAQKQKMRSDYAWYLSQTRQGK